MEPASRLALGREPQYALELSHFVDWLSPIGVIGSGPAGHALAITSSTHTLTPGNSPSGRVMPHDLRSRRFSLALRYYDPLGLPLDDARFHLRLIRAIL